VVPGPGDFEIEVLDADPRRLKKVRITRTRAVLHGASEAPDRARRVYAAKRRPPHLLCRSPRPTKATVNESERAYRAAVARIVLAWGWRRALVAFAAGALSALALAAGECLPGAVSHVPVAIWLIEGASAAGSAALISAAIAAGGSGSVFSWPGSTGSALHSGRRQDFAWLLPFAVIGLPAGLAFYTRSHSQLPACCGRADRCVSLLWRSRSPQRMAARPSALRLSVEHDRLFAHRALGAGAGLRADRAMGLTFLAVWLFASPAVAGRRGERYAAAVVDGGDPLALVVMSPSMACCVSRARRRNTSTA